MSGITISADSGTTFESGAAQYNAVAMLDANTFVVAYQDADDSNKGKAIIGTRIGTTISLGSIATFETGEVSIITVVALSSSLIVISYKRDTDTYVYVIAGTISGTTITFGTAVALSSAATTGVTVASLDATDFVASYIVPSLPNLVSSKVGSVSGTTISLGAVQGFTATSSAVPLHSFGLNGTDYIMVYRTFSSPPDYYTRAKVGICNTVAQTISFGAEAVIEQNVAGATVHQVAVFDSLHFIVFYASTTNNYIKACSINDTTHAITLGTRVDDTTNISNIAICTPDSTHFLVSYVDADDSNKGKVRAGSLSGSTTIAWDAEGSQTFDTHTITYTGVCNLDGSYFLVGFKKAA